MDEEGVEPSLVGQLVFKWTWAIWGKGRRLCRTPKMVNRDGLILKA